MEALERDAGEAAADASAAAAQRRADLESIATGSGSSSADPRTAALLEGFARSDFNAVDFINQRFPTEHSLSAAEDVSVMLRGVTLQLEHDMQQAVRAQATSKDRGQQELAAAKSTIHGLFDRIGQIQTKARRTEATVEGICGGIRQLDAAKQNLTSTVTALRRLQMLVQAVDQLERTAGSRQYGTAPGLLDATNQLADHFERYRDVPKIAELQRKIDATVMVRARARAARSLRRHSSGCLLLSCQFGARGDGGGGLLFQPVVLRPMWSIRCFVARCCPTSSVSWAITIASSTMRRPATTRAMPTSRRCTTGPLRTHAPS
jgi:hypothetical protein